MCCFVIRLAHLHLQRTCIHRNFNYSRKSNKVEIEVSILLLIVNGILLADIYFPTSAALLNPAQCSSLHEKIALCFSTLNNFNPYSHAIDHTTGFCTETLNLSDHEVFWE